MEPCSVCLHEFTEPLTSFSWHCARCHGTYLKEDFDEHFVTQEVFSYSPRFDCYVRTEYLIPDLSTDEFLAGLLAARALESRRPRGGRALEPKRSSNKLVMLAFERHIADNVLRKAKAMDLEEERIQLVRLKLDILRNQLLQFLENEEVGELERVEYFEDMEVIADKLLNELVFSWRCSVRNSGY